MKVLGSSVIQRTRGRKIELRSETKLSSCSTLTADEALASYSWELVAANESYPREQEVPVGVSRDPRVLVIPSHTLGYAGSSYVFQLMTAYGSEAFNAANVTGKLAGGGYGKSIAWAFKILSTCEKPSLFCPSSGGALAWVSDMKATTCWVRNGRDIVWAGAI